MSKNAGGPSLSERHTRILALLEEQGSVSVSELSELFRVSEVTIRKDLSVLERQKRLYRTHGRAILISSCISDRSTAERRQKNIAQKRAIAVAAAALIEPNDSITIASGTTVTYLAQEIRPAGPLTVIAASVIVTQILSQVSGAEVIQLPGLIRPASMSAVGPYAERMLQHFNCTKLFIGADGIDPDFGLTTADMLEASLNKAMIAASQKVIVLADSSKFGRRSFGKICAPEAVDLIITDTATPQHYIDRLREHGIEVLLVEA